MSIETYQATGGGGKVFSSERSLGIIRPILYPQKKYEQASAYPDSLAALHLATDGAFYEVPIGAQAVTVVPSIKSIESYVAPKKGGVFDSKKVRDVYQSIVDHEHPNDAFALTPLQSDFGPLELERASGGYRVSMVFERSEVHSESIACIAEHLGDYALKHAGKDLKEDDKFALDLANELSPRMLVGFIEANELPDDLRETAANDPFGFHEAASTRYQSMVELGYLEDERAPAQIAFSESEIWFGALQLATLARKPKRTRMNP